MSSLGCGFCRLAKYHIEILEEPDYIAAFKWQSIAAALNINRAAKLRDETATNLSIDEIHAVQQETFTLFDQNNYADKFSKTTDEKN